MNKYYNLVITNKTKCIKQVLYGLLVSYLNERKFENLASATKCKLNYEQKLNEVEVLSNRDNFAFIEVDFPKFTLFSNDTSVNLNNCFIKRFIVPIYFDFEIFEDVLS